MLSPDNYDDDKERREWKSKAHNLIVFLLKYLAGLSAAIGLG